ncbi:unnamed protein product [Polarella glacialis]|uniref:Uncharacterized protein n=1 Tax=Polarella glacialis TaxID=89957 RepID=A0A813ICR8_POLGL|nr:unnamed protein product [Polarella glacialis]
MVVVVVVAAAVVVAPGAMLGVPQGAQDWPLSREEKKSQILRLYNDDVRAADSMLCSGEATLEALREELDAVRRAAGIHKVSLPGKGLGSTVEYKDAEVQRLRAAVETAAAVLRAILPPPDDEPEGVEVGSPTNHGFSSLLRRSRARSEGASRDGAAAALRPALRPRGKSREGKPRRVSFGKQPEEEPGNQLQHEEDDDLTETMVKLDRPPSRRSSKPLKDGLKQDAPPLLRPSLKVHLLWNLCSISLAVCFGYGAFQLGSSASPRPFATIGDPECWMEGFKPEFCCAGPSGNSKCWDHFHTYERCCQTRNAILSDL